jgi:Ni,Fe-hydrogenase III large subunit/Ni,Fe-hydrogenase III component G
MNTLPTLQPILDELRQRFGAQIEAVDVARADEVQVQTNQNALSALCAFLYRRHKARLTSVFAEDLRNTAEKCFRNYYVFALDAAHAYLVLHTAIRPDKPEFVSLTTAVPAVNWQEREIQDWFGLKAIGHPNPRRMALHDDWPEVYPLRRDFDFRTKLAPFTGERHSFRKVEGEGVFQVPVGPVHAGIIEPGHFLFSVAGEPVLYLQIRLFYTHKGTEKLFEAIPAPHGVFLAESISGDSSFSHSTAYCQALERAADLAVPPRAKYLRTILLELERIYNHVADIGAIATDVAFVVANAHAMQLKEQVLQLNEHLAGNRLLRGMNCIGGVRRDFDDEQLQRLKGFLPRLRREFEMILELVLSSTSTIDRLEATGILAPQIAKDLGIVGVAGRASGGDMDVRRDHPYAAYDQVKFQVPVYTNGDVLHRLKVRADEVHESLSILSQALEQIPAGPVATEWKTLPPNRCALGFVEGWRGEIVHWVRTAENNRLARCRVKDPSLQNWPALSEAILGNIVPDFPVCNKSFNLSYSGTDR